jgi:hypothetical protein
MLRSSETICAREKNNEKCEYFGKRIEMICYDLTFGRESKTSIWNIFLTF